MRLMAKNSVGNSQKVGGGAKNSLKLGGGMGGDRTGNGTVVKLPTPNRANTPKPVAKPASETPKRGTAYPQMDSGRKK